MNITKKRTQDQKAKKFTNEKAEEIKDIIQDFKIILEDLRIGIDQLWSFIVDNE